LSLVSGSTFAGLGGGAAALVASRYVPAQHRVAAMVGGVALVGLGALSLLNDGKKNTDDFIAAGGLLGLIGGLLKGKPKPPVSPAVVDSPQSEKHWYDWITADFVNEGQVVGSAWDGLFLAVVQFKNGGEPQLISPDFTVYETGLNGKFETEHKSPQISIPTGISHREFLLPTKGLSLIINSKAEVRLSYAGVTIANGYNFVT
jgi:hypothetical protein